MIQGVRMIQKYGLRTALLDEKLMKKGFKDMVRLKNLHKNIMYRLKEQSILEKGPKHRQ